MNTGPLIAGIIGKHQPAYDVRGHTANMASRLEQASRPGTIKISRTPYDSGREFIPWISRGKLTINHGHQIEMFFAGEG